MIIFPRVEPRRVLSLLPIQEVVRGISLLPVWEVVRGLSLFPNQDRPTSSFNRPGSSLDTVSNMDVATYRIDRVPSSLEIGTSNLDRGSSSSLDEDYTFSSTRFGTMLYSPLF